MKVVFYGTPEFALPTLERLIDSSHEVVAVVTQPDRPAGRGRKLTPPPVKVRALEAGLPVIQYKSARDPELLETLRPYAPDVAVVVAYGNILPKTLLDLPKHGSLNIHASLLPKYRGAAPIQWAIVNGETKSGVSIMQMDEGMDTGPEVARAEVDILEDDDAISLSGMLSLQGSALMVEVLDELEAKGSLESTEQDHASATRAPMISKDDARINWSLNAEKVILMIRGFLPWPRAWTMKKEDRYAFTGAEACAAEWLPGNAFEDRIPTGAVLEALKGRGFAVKCGEKTAVLITRVQPPGKPEMGGFDAVNGGSVKIGDLFE